jgi:surfeit locus 1 family protein
MQFKFLSFYFKPTFLGTVITLLCIPIFIKLGFWQYNKAMLKQSIQDAYVKSEANGSSNFTHYLNSPELLQYKKVIVFGKYEPKYQILIDNQVENDQAGFHVVTPLKIENSNQYILVNRGWIVGKDKHTDVPAFSTPIGNQQIEGMVWLPSKKIFTLEGPTTNQRNDWQLVWQNLDMDKYRKNVPLPILPVIIKLDPKSNAGGFVRNWQVPTDRIMTNLGYAYQWFGFAFAAIVIYLYMSTTRIKKELTKT